MNIIVMRLKTDNLHRGRIEKQVGCKNKIAGHDIPGKGWFRVGNKMEMSSQKGVKKDYEP